MKSILPWGIVLWIMTSLFFYSCKGHNIPEDLPAIVHPDLEKLRGDGGFHSVELKKLNNNLRELHDLLTGDDSTMEELEKNMESGIDNFKLQMEQGVLTLEELVENLQ
ncbi:MAG: hypothetical protein PF447_04810 [Spirochaetaceae bacterium]|jgi:hypothetical protein|nr:hypothetical protein [Spirochaetaceae bacterium]